MACGGVPPTLVRGLWPGRRGGLFRCVGGGFMVLVGGPPPAVVGLGGSSFRFCLLGRGWPTPVHGSGLRVRHDLEDLGAERSLEVLLGSSCCTVCPAKAAVDSVHTYVCFIGVAVAGTVGSAGFVTAWLRVLGQPLRGLVPSWYH
jgi:hypothetical protein